LSTIAIIAGLIPNVISQNTVRWMLRTCAYSTTLLLGIYWIFTTFYNGINTGINADGNTIVQASDSYCWVVGVLFGAWEFYGYDASVHLAEETHEASSVVAHGMWTGTVCTWLLSIPTLALVLLCMQDFEGVVQGSYMNNWGTVNHIKFRTAHADLPP
jgi:amino acid transporter